jgi:hypothetical protein
MLTLDQADAANAVLELVDWSSRSQDTELVYFSERTVLDERIDQSETAPTGSKEMDLARSRRAVRAINKYLERA